MTAATVGYVEVTEHLDITGVPEHYGHVRAGCLYGRVPEAQPVSSPYADSAITPCPQCVGGKNLVGFDDITRQAEVTNVRRPEPEHEPGAGKGPDVLLAEATLFVTSLDRKVEVADLTRDLVRGAEVYLSRYTGDFEFLLDIKAKRRHLSDGQAKGVLNCLRAEVFRSQRSTRPESGLDISSLPTGHYAYEPDDGQAQFYKVDNLVLDPQGGRWDGWVFVKAEYGGSNYEKAGSQRPGQTYQGPRERALRAIAEAPAESSLLYGRLLGVCGVCHRTLTNEESRARGIGPDCAQKTGW